MPPSDLHNLLKNETHDAHIKMHGHPLLQPLRREDITQDQYQHILQGFYDFYNSYEGRFVAVDGKFENELSPLKLLEMDFAAFGLTPENNAMADNRAQSCFSEYLGYLYVKQGSTLGGQYISAQLKKNLGLEKGKTLFFFNGYGSDTGKRWREFLQYLDDNSATVHKNKVVSYACTVFNDMKLLFDQHLKITRSPE